MRSYLQTWGDHSMRSTVLPWYPGGHVLSYMQGRHPFFSRPALGGIPKEKTKQKITKTATPHENGYPGGHVLSNMQSRHLYLQDRQGEGSQKKKQSKKSRRLQLNSFCIISKALHFSSYSLRYVFWP